MRHTFLESTTICALLSAGALLSGCANPGPTAQGAYDLPRQLLSKAAQAVQQHQQAPAYADVDQAETIWVKRNQTYYANAFVPEEPPELREMARAKQAIQMQDWQAADYYIRTAMRGQGMVRPGPD